MRITGNRQVDAPRRVSATPASARSDTVSGLQDTVSVAGVPKSELTPRVMAALTKLMDEVGALREELSQANAKIAELSTLAFTDPLTGVHNRRAFVGELDRTIAVVERHGQTASVAYFDVDDMKSINDDYGHAGGDAAIAHVAATIKDNVRATDVVGRLGGDEFGVIFAYADQEATAGKVREIQAEIANSRITVGADSFRVTVTAGVAPLKKGETAASSLNVADAAMYVGKSTRRSERAKAS